MKMEDCSLRGAKLYCATHEDAKRCSEAYERDAFRYSQNNGTRWTPTRQLVEECIYRTILRHDQFYRMARNLYIAVALEGVAIIVISALVLLL